MLWCFKMVMLKFQILGWLKRQFKAAITRLYQVNMTINIGTRFYFAPEMLLRKGYDKKVDLWALGVYLYEMSSFSLPFLTEDITPQRF